MLQYSKSNKYKSKRNAIVIGGGIGGIAAAIRVNALGYKTTLIERLSALGGRAQVFKKNGYIHDAGPTVLTAPFLFDELFTLLGTTREEHVDFRALDPWYSYYFHTGETFDYRAEVPDTLEEIRKFNFDDTKNYLRLLAASEKIFDVGFTELSSKPFNNLSTMILQTPNILRLGGYRTVSQFVNSYLKHPLLRKAFSIHPLLVGGNPFSTTSIYSLIHFLERKWGVHFCMGGTGNLIRSLYELMCQNQIDVVLETDIARLEVSDKIVKYAISSTGTKYEADLFISNIDPPTLFDEVLPYKRSPFNKILPDSLTTYSMGLFVLFFGTKKRYENIAHHTIWMGKRFKSLLTDIFKNKTLSDDFSLYLHRPTATDTSFAPKGNDSFYVLCPVPNLLASINWKVEGPKLSQRIIEALDKTIMPDLSKHYVDDFFMTPEDFRSDYRSTHGAGFSIAPSLTQSAWFRYHNHDSSYKNLFLVGAGTHPGAGMPGVLCSAKVIEELIINKNIH
ncbi:MAG: phytoene dehydrogenase [Methylococcaceae bacterium TMED69]|nr:MAG: phytoene dehydrogenase [Methylococcaceae bacterium TMED69]